MPSVTVDLVRLKAALEKATAALLAERNSRGFWEGELSSSALSTATAVTALAIALKHGASFQSAIRNPQSAIDSGLTWLATDQNSDGGWGDTTKSLSNISTTTLCWAAFGAAGADGKFASVVEKAERWLESYVHVHGPASDAGGIARAASAGAGDSPRSARLSTLPAAIIARYGKDRTFSVPILTLCALARRLGEGRSAWEHVIPLPFELAACPHQLFAALRLPVVSYALPALIAIGQARHVHAPSRNPLTRLVRNATREKTLRKLSEIQPANGGFLEATPLTSFVTMSLAASGQANHVVTRRGLDFLLRSQRPDGSWPIDTNLSTWCTTLAIEALPPLEGRVPRVPDHDRGSVGKVDGDSWKSSLQLIDWLLNQQYKVEHPYTHAAPGGWAWTDLPGGVPDADDTAGALLALAKLLPRSSRREEALTGTVGTDQSLLTSAATNREEFLRAAEAGIRWLLDLQNRDGGIPTFCRGWGALPFDRSSADITAQAIRAWIAWDAVVDSRMRAHIRKGVQHALGFLSRIQQPRGAFVPLWFGNQLAADELNRTYGTSRVLKAASMASHSVEFRSPLAAHLHNGCVQWLVTAQNADGGWGAEANLPSSVEETALAVESLALACRSNVTGHAAAVERGARWLIDRVEDGSWRESSAIGFYFAKLWYFERLYPMIFTVGALRAADEVLDKNGKSDGPKTAA